MSDDEIKDAIAALFDRVFWQDYANNVMRPGLLEGLKIGDALFGERSPEQKGRGREMLRAIECGTRSAALAAFVQGARHVMEIGSILTKEGK